MRMKRRDWATAFEPNLAQSAVPTIDGGDWGRNFFFQLVELVPKMDYVPEVYSRRLATCFGFCPLSALRRSAVT